MVNWLAVCDGCYLDILRDGIRDFGLEVDSLEVLQVQRENVLEARNVFIYANLASHFRDWLR